MKQAFPSLARLLACSALLLGLMLTGCGDSSNSTQPVRELPDADRSTVTVSKDKGVRANGKDSVTITVTVLKADGTPLANRTVKVTVPDGDVTQPSGPTDAQGVATATLTSTVVGTKTVTVAVDADGGAVTLSQRPSVEFVLLPATRLAFTAAPSSGTAGDPLGAFEITLQDADGQTVVGAHDTVTVRLGSGPAAAMLLGKTSVTAVNGVARLTGLRLEKAATGYTLVASATGFTDITSPSFDVVAAAPASFALSHPTTSLQAGAAWQVELSVFDSYANLASSYTGTVHFSSDDTGATLPADYTFTATDAGHHTFSPGLTLTRAGTRRVTVKDTVLASLIDALEVPVVPGAPRKLVFAQQPGNHSVRAPFGLQVALTDAYGNMVSSGTASVALSLNNHGTLDGATSVSAVDGLATFSGLSVEEENTGYVLTASGSGLDFATSAAFTITDDVPPAVPVLSLTDATATSVTIGWTAVGDDGTLGKASSYELRYASAPIASEADFLAATPVTGLAAPGVPGSAESAKISGLAQGSTYYVALKVTDSAGNSTRSATLTVSTPYPSASQLAFTQQPQNGVAGSVLAPIKVEIRDAGGLVVSNATTAVTLKVVGTTGYGPFTVTADKGVATFNNVRIDTAGAGYTLSATAVPLTPATSTPFDISPANPSKLELTGLPSSVTAGTAQGVTVTVKDAFDNLEQGYTGTVSFASSDTAASLPADYTFTLADKGQHAFTGVVLRTAGTQTLSVAAAGLTGASASATVSDAPPSKLLLAGIPASLVAGASTTFTVERQDGFGARDTGFTGTVHFTSTDSQAVVPADYTFTTADMGLHTFTVTLKTVGDQSLKVEDTAKPSISDTATSHVTWAPVASLVFSAPPSVVAGNALTASVTAQDAYGNTVKDYAGTVGFSADTAGATLPANYTFVASDEGVRQFTFTLPHSGTTTLTVTDAAAGLSATASIVVNPALVSKLVLSAPPGPFTAGTAFSVDVVAQDSLGNIASDYTGTVHFSSSDTRAVLPADVTFGPGDAGHGTFSVTLKTSGSQSLTVQDTATASLSATTSITVTAGMATAFTLEVPATGVAGSVLNGTVSVWDAYGNPASSYTGTVSFSADTPGATLPVDYTFSASDNGQHPFTFTLQKVGPNTLTVKDLAAGLSASATVTLSSTAVSSLVAVAPSGPFTAGTAFSVDVTLQDSFGNVASDYTGTLHFSSSDAQAVLPADTTFTSADAGHKTFSVTLKTAGNPTVTVTDVAQPSLTSTLTRQVNPGSPAKLAFGTQPANRSVRAALPDVTVALLDSFGNTVPASSPSVTVGLVGGNPAATLSGALTVAPVSGVATFSGLSVDQQGTSFHLEAVGASLDGASSQTFDIVDDVAPATAALTLSHQTSTQVQVDWVAVGDDGTLGTAASHALRYSTSPITPATFGSATAVSLGAPQPAGSAESVIVTGLTPSTAYYFALQVTDDAGNTSFATQSTSTNADPCAGYICTAAAPSCAPDGVSRVTATATCVDVSNAPVCQQTETVTACTGSNAVCYQGACDTAVKPAANQIVLTEVMHTPSSGTTEYFELTNTTSNLLNLNGITVSYVNAAGTETTFVVGSGSVPVVVARKGAIVLGANKTLASNGGVPVDYQYPASVVLDGSGQFNFFDGDTLLESLGYTSSFPQTSGKAMSLSSRILGSSANVFSWYWCDADTLLPGGNYGSPGAANSSCGMTSTPTVDFCNIQSPKTIPSVVVGAATTITSRVHGTSVTDRNHTGNDYYPYLFAELGYGPTTGSAAAWTWTPILGNGAYTATTDDDETKGSLTFATAGSYRYGFRYHFVDPVTGPSSYVYCDQSGVADPSTGNFGTVTVNSAAPVTNHVVISEFSGGTSAAAKDEFVELYNPTNSPVDLNGWTVQYKSATGTTYSGTTTINSTTAPGGTIIQPKHYFLIVGSAYSGSVAADATHNFDASASTTGGGHIRIGPGLDASNLSDPKTVDKLGYGTANSPEGSAAPSHPASGGSLERKAYSTSTSSTMATGGADASKGNSYDSDNNANDFVTRAVRDPQNSASPAEAP